MNFPQDAHIDRLITAISEDLQGTVDAEERGPIDNIIPEIRSLPENKPLWNSAIEQIVSEGRFQGLEWWALLEHLISSSELKPPQLGRLIEQRVETGDFTDPHERAMVFSLLSTLGMPATTRTLMNDFDLRETVPTIWMDLLLAGIPRAIDAQDILLDLVRRRRVTTMDLMSRLNDIRAMGGNALGSWLRRLRSCIPVDDLTFFDGIIDDAFGRPKNVESSDSQLKGLALFIARTPLKASFARMPRGCLA